MKNVSVELESPTTAMPNACATQAKYSAGGIRASRSVSSSVKHAGPHPSSAHHHATPNDPRLQKWQRRRRIAPPTPCSIPSLSSSLPSSRATSHHSLAGDPMDGRGECRAPGAQSCRANGATGAQTSTQLSEAGGSRREIILFKLN